MMIKKSKLKLAAMVGIGALALTGCATEFIEADGNCAEITTGDFPALYADRIGDVSSDSYDLYFEFQTTGAKDEVFTYASMPNPKKLPFIGEAIDPVTESLFDSLSDEAFLVERHNGSLDVTDSSPHRVNMDGYQQLIFMGLGLPVGAIATCDLSGYNAQLGPSPSPSPSDYFKTELTNATAKDFYPGYDADQAESSINNDGVLTVDFNDNMDVAAANVFVVPFIQAFGDPMEANLETSWYAALIGLQTVGDPTYIFQTTSNPDDVLELTFPYADYDYMSSWVAGPYQVPFGDEAVLTGALIVISTLDQIDDNTQRMRYSFQVAGFSPDGTLGAPNFEPTATEYTGPQYEDEHLKGKPGEQVTLTGTNMKVNSATIGGKSARIVSNTATSLTLEIPADLAGGKHSVKYVFDGGEVTRQLGATVIDHSVWTKRLSDTQAKLYGKNIAGAGKVTFNLNGREIAWVNAVDATDPKLRKANGDHYLVRTVNLKSGKNVLEIFVDGTRERRTVYTR